MDAVAAQHGVWVGSWDRGLAGADRKQPLPAVPAGHACRARKHRRRLSPVTASSCFSSTCSENLQREPAAGHKT